MASADAVGVVVSCPSCGQRTRLRYDTLGRRTRCGKCQHDVQLPGVPVEVASAEAFDALTRQTSIPVLVDFWAEWCGPCHVVAPHVAEVARRMAGELIVAKVDTDGVPDVAARSSIRSIPTLAVFAGGREVQRTAGAAAADDIERFVRTALGS